jgi:hypothetical protein
MTATRQPDHTRAPGIIPRPVHVHDDAALPPAAATEQRDEPTVGTRNPVRLAAAKVMSALRGDKYMVDAYPTDGRADSTAPEDAEAKAEER